MGFDIANLKVQIRAILEEPGTDLTTISAKRVRKRLLELNADLTAEYVKDNKDEIDSLIGIVFEQVSAVAEPAEGGEGDDTEEDYGKRKREYESDVEEGAEEEDKAPPKKAKRGRKGESGLTDAEIARQLSQELNGRSRSSRSGVSSKPARGKGAAKKSGKRAAKSATTVDSEGEGGEEGKPKKRGGFTKEYALSEPLAALLSVDKLSRPQVVKQLWDYIKKNSLQDPADKREIICDDSLRAVFGVDKIGMFKMNKVLGQHLHEPAPA